MSCVRELWFVSQYAGEACGRGSGAAAHRGSADGQVWRRHDADGPDVQRRFIYAHDSDITTNNPVVSTDEHIHSLFCVTEKRVLQPHDSIYSESLVAPGRLIACRRDLSEILVGQTMSALHCNCVRFWGLKPECSSVMVFVSLSRHWLNVLSWDRSLSDCWVSIRGTWPWLLPTSTGISSTPSMRWSSCQTLLSSLNQLLNDIAHLLF